MTYRNLLLIPALASTIVLAACSSNPIPSPSPTTVATTAPTPVLPSASPAAMHGEDSEKITDDRTFILHMIPHHEEAVTSSEQFLKRTKNPKLVTIANGIITAQKKEIADMKTWYKSWFGTDYVADGKYEKMMPDFIAMELSRVDARFMQNMIEHHQAAIEAARAAKPVSTHHETKQLADAIVLAQTKEINEFKSLLAAMGEDDHDDTGEAPHDD